MTDREKVIKGLECCARDYGQCGNCPYDDFGAGRKGCGWRLYEDALALLKDRTKDYVEWAKQVGAHTCASCKRRDCDCPIENEYALPMDGYCHLWDGGKLNETDN